MLFQIRSNISQSLKRAGQARILVFVLLCLAAPLIFNHAFYLSGEYSLVLKITSLIFLVFIQILLLSILHDIRLQRLTVSVIYGIGSFIIIQNAIKLDEVERPEQHYMLMLSGDIAVILLSAYLAYVVLTVRFRKENITQRVMVDMAVTVGMLAVLCIVVSSTYLSTMKSVIAIRESKIIISPYAEMYDFLSYVKQNILARSRSENRFEVDKPYRSNGRVGVLFIDDGVRASNLSINGYQRQTTPLLEKRSLYNFKSVKSCHTSTSISLPCILSILGEAHFLKGKNSSAPTLADILELTNVDVLVINGSKERKVLEVEVSKVLKDYSSAGGVDTLIVYIHSGSDINRVPYNKYKNTDKFTPSCSSRSLLSCTRKEIINSYDNSIYNTDMILDRVIGMLDVASIESFLLYTSDHGESLGEYGLYGHGFPKILAPFEQTYVPLFIWASDDLSINNIDNLNKCKLDPLNHDVVAHTVLSFFEVILFWSSNSGHILSLKHGAH